MKNLIRKMTALTAVQMLLMTSGAFAQEQIRQDNVVIGKPSTAADKTLKFDTNDGVLNPSLSVEKVSKKLKYNQNDFQLGGSSTTDSKSIIFNGDNKSLLYEGTANELQYNGDLLSVGDGTNTEKTLKFNKGATSPSIKWNPTTSKLQFSNNAVDFKDIGAGGGASSSGVNLLDNDSFEDPVTTGWTNSGGTFSQQVYTNGSENDLKYARFVASGAGEYFESTLRTIPTNFNGGGCQADFKKANVSASGLFKIEVLDSSANVLSTANINQLTWNKIPTISFVCPTAGTTAKVRITSLAAGTIQVDNAYVGSNQNLVSLSQARLFGTLSYAGVAGCTFSTSSTTFTNFSANASCATPTVSGSLKIPATKIPAFVIPSGSPAGTYQVVVSSIFQKGGTTAEDNKWRLHDGTNAYLGTGYNYSGTTNASANGGFTSSYTYGSNIPSDITIQVQGLASNAGTSSATINVAEINTGLVFQVFYFPAGQETAVSPEQASWFIDANIGGSNIPVTVAQSAYTQIENGSLDLVINTSKGSASDVQIACTSGTSSSGLNCGASNESLGIAFTPPYVGIFEVCTELTMDVVTGGEAVFQLVETPNNSQTVIQEGGSRKGVYGASGNRAPYSTCGTFNFSDTSKRTIRLMYEKPNTNAVNMYIDRSGSDGQRDMRWTVKPLLSAFNRPILTGDQLTVPGSLKQVHYSGMVSSSGVITNKKGTIATSATWGGLSGGVATMSLTNVHATRLNCTCNVSDAVASTAVFWCMPLSNGTTSSQSFVTYANAVGPRDFTYQCDGELP